MSKKTRKEQKEPRKLELATEVATREVATFVTSMDYLPNPDEILKAQGGNIKVYRSMVDAHMDAVKDKRFAAVTSRPWNIDGSKGNPKTAKIVEDHLWNNLHIRDVENQMLAAIGLGYAVHEVVWDAVQTEGGTFILPVALKERPQEWFKFDPDGNLVFVEKSGGIITLPDRKFIVTRRRASASNPYGEPVLSRCFWPIAFKKGGLKFWMIFIEKFGIPKAVGKIPSGSTKQEQVDFLRMLSGLVRDAVAVIPQNGTVELLETANAASTPHKAIIDWADAEISKAWLGETLTTEQTSSGGTQAMATVHNEVRADLALDDAAMLEESFNTLIRWIWEINWPSEKNIPWMNVQMPEDMQLGRLERDQKLNALGVRFNKDYISEVYGVDQKYFEVVEPTQAAIPGANFAEHEDGCSCFAEKKMSKSDLEKNVEDMVASLTDKDLQDQVEEIARPIIELAEKCGNYAEFEEALNKAIPNLESKKLEKSVEKCLLLAEMAGRLDG